MMMAKSSSWSRLQDKLADSFSKLSSFLEVNKLGSDFGEGFAFNRFDADGSGSLGREEIVTAFKTLGIPLSDEEIALILNKMDPNHDNVISLEEFEHAIKAMSGAGNFFRSSTIHQLKQKRSEHQLLLSAEEDAVARKTCEREIRDARILGQMDEEMRKREAAKEKRRQMQIESEAECRRQAEAQAFKLQQARAIKLRGNGSRKVLLKKRRCAFRSGQLIEAYGPGDRNFHPGKILGVNRNGTYNIELNEHGQKNRYTAVEEGMIRTGPRTIVMERLRQEFVRGSALRSPPKAYNVLWPRTTNIPWEKPNAVSYVRSWQYSKRANTTVQQQRQHSAAYPHLCV